MTKQLLLISSLLYTCIAFSQQWYSSPAPHGNDINCIKIFNRDTIITAGGRHIISQFQTAISPAYFRTNISGLGLWNVASDVDPNQHWIRSIDFTDENNGIAIGWGGKISSTTDGGTTWGAASSPINRDFNKIFFINTQVMIIAGGAHPDSIAGGRQTILKSINGGQSWNVVMDQPGKGLQSVYFINGSNGYAVGDSGTILKSVNGGDTWSPVTSPIVRDFNAIWFTDATTGFIVGGQPTNDSIRTILRTTTGGNTWTVLKDELGGMLRDIHFVNTSIGYAVGGNATVLKTTDGGLNWIPQVIPGTVGDEQFNVVRFHDTDFGFVAGKWGVQYIYNTVLPPQAQTIGADVPDTMPIILKGLVNSHGESCVYTFRFSSDNFSSDIWESAYPGSIRSNSLEPATFSLSGLSLTPNRSYDMLIKAWTLGGLTYGDTVSFYFASDSAITTFSATGINGTSATLSGSIREFPIPVDLYFEYGTTPLFGSQIAATPATVNDTSLHSVSANISPLQLDTVYFYRLKAVSGSSNYYGNTLTFYSGTYPFTALETLLPTDILDASAVLNGQVEGFKIPATLSFEYSAGAMTFHNTVAGTPSQLNDSLYHLVNAAISGLTPATLYYYRLKAETTTETFYGDTISFYSTLTADNSIHTMPATNVTFSSAELHGEIGGFGVPVDLSFEYGATSSFGSVITATPNSINDTATHAVTASLSGLQSDEAYYYRLKAEIASGAIYYGETRQFYTGNSEIPNWDFQYWKRDTVFLANAWNMLGDDFERVPGRSGNYAIKLSGQTLALLGIFYDTGQNNDLAFLKGVPFHSRPDSISLYVNYVVDPGDSAVILAHLYDAAFNDISTTLFQFGGNSGGAFTRIAFPLNYNSSLMPDSISFGIMASAPEGRLTDNYVIVDDIAGVPSSPVIYNGDFENWFEYSSNVLLSWFYIKDPLIDPDNLIENPMVAQSFFSPPGDYAAEISNFSLGSGLWVSGEISTKTSFTDKAYGGFPVNSRHQSLNGYFKWFPENGDSMTIIVQMFSGQQEIGYGQLLQGPAVTEFTMFDIPIIYSAANTIPDTATLTLRSSYSSPPKGGSRLVVDKLSFDGFVGVEEINAARNNEPPGITVFPNPTSSIITIQLEKEMKGTVEVFNLHGSRMYAADFSGNKLEVNTTDFPKGLYMVRISQGVKKLVNRFIVIR